MKGRTLGIVLLLLSMAVSLPLVWLRLQTRPTEREARLVAGARSCLGDVYDADRYEGGPPPRGRSACTDVVYWAYRPVLDLRQAVKDDRIANGDEPLDPDLDYRWCPRLILWFQRHAISLPTEVNRDTVLTFRAGDVIFFSDGESRSGTAHVGIVSDRWSLEGKPLLIHNPGPRGVEENALTATRIVGHFRLP